MLEVVSDGIGAMHLVLVLPIFYPNPDVLGRLPSHHGRRDEVASFSQTFFIVGFAPLVGATKKVLKAEGDQVVFSLGKIGLL